MITMGLCVFATGLVALSLESVGAALMLFGLAGWLLSQERRPIQPKLSGVVKQVLIRLASQGP